MAFINFNSKKVKRRMAFINGFGAAIVVIGALFKILHLPGGDTVIGAGLITEAFLFMIGAFEPVPTEYHWENVYPDLLGHSRDDLGIGEEYEESNVRKVSGVMSNSDIDSDLVSKLDRSINQFTQVLDSMSQLSSLSNLHKNASDYSNQISLATQNVNTLNNVYLDQINQVNSQLNASNDFVSTLKESVDSTKDIRNELESLKSNLTSLNSVYGAMLSAMNR